MHTGFNDNESAVCCSGYVIEIVEMLVKQHSYSCLSLLLQGGLGCDPDWLCCVVACLHNWKSAWRLPCCHVASTILYFDGLRHRVGCPLEQWFRELSPRAPRKSSCVEDSGFNLPYTAESGTGVLSHQKALTNQCRTCDTQSDWMNSCVAWQSLFHNLHCILMF